MERIHVTQERFSAAPYEHCDERSCFIKCLEILE
jgi:hypothetical protein